MLNVSSEHSFNVKVSKVSSYLTHFLNHVSISYKKTDREYYEYYEWTNRYYEWTDEYY